MGAGIWGVEVLYVTWRGGEGVVTAGASAREGSEVGVGSGDGVLRGEESLDSGAAWRHLEGGDGVASDGPWGRAEAATGAGAGTEAWNAAGAEAGALRAVGSAGGGPEWCRFTCRSRLLRLLQEKEQWQQACGLAPVWIQRWRRSEARQVNWRPHAPQSRAWGGGLAGATLSPPTTTTRTACNTTRGGWVGAHAYCSVTRPPSIYSSAKYCAVLCLASPPRPFPTFNFR